MITFAIVNQKGGCGKTITSVNTAAGLSRLGYRVLLIDLDPQAHATFSLRKNPSSTITDALELISSGQNIDLQVYTQQVNEMFFMIPSSMGLVSLEQTLSSRQYRYEMLSQVIKQAQGKFDYCFIDCPPNLGTLSLNALCASDYCLTPLTMCDFALRGVELLKNILIMLKDYNAKAPAPFYLLSQVDNRSRFSKEFSQRIKQQLGSLLLKTNIRSSVCLRAAASAGQHIFDYAPDSRGALDFSDLAKEIEQISAQTRWAPVFLRGQNLNEVYIVGDFNQWEKQEDFRLRKIGTDIWSTNLALQKGVYRYKFVADNQWFADPANQTAEDDAFGGKNSILEIR